MPRDPRFGPICRRLIEDHGILPLFDTDNGELPMGQLWKPKPTPEEVTETFTEFLEDLFEAAFELQEPAPPEPPDIP
jgi:hypothetical protein